MNLGLELHPENIYDAETIYEAGRTAVKSSSFKYRTQLYDMFLLLNTAKTQRDLLHNSYVPDKDYKFRSVGRGKVRFISNNSIRDKATIHVLCDEIVTKVMRKYLIYDNSSSQKGKGITFHRKRFEEKVRRFYRQHGHNRGWILLADFKGYYANMMHDIVLKIYNKLIKENISDIQAVKTSLILIRDFMKSFEVDVSRFTDEEIEVMKNNPIDPSINVMAAQELLTGERMLRKGMEIGNQLSQNTGLLYTSKVDNYAKIVKGIKAYGRYTDDFYAISESRKELEELLAAVEGISKECGFFINKKKTKIVPISQYFRYLQIMYRLDENGKLIRKINPRNLTRARKRFKAYRHLWCDGKMTYQEIENCFKCWMCAHYKIMSRRQIHDISKLFYDLFGMLPKWSKGHGKIKYYLEYVRANAPRENKTLH